MKHHHQISSTQNIKDEKSKVKRFFTTLIELIALKDVTLKITCLDGLTWGEACIRHDEVRGDDRGRASGGREQAPGGDRGRGDKGRGGRGRGGRPWRPRPRRPRSLTIFRSWFVCLNDHTSTSWRSELMRSIWSDRVFILWPDFFNQQQHCNPPRVYAILSLS